MTVFRIEPAQHHLARLPVRRFGVVQSRHGLLRLRSDSLTYDLQTLSCYTSFLFVLVASVAALTATNLSLVGLASPAAAKSPGTSTGSAPTTGDSKQPGGNTNAVVKSGSCFCRPLKTEFSRDKRIIQHCSSALFRQK